MRDTGYLGGNNRLDNGVVTYNERAWKRLYNVRRKATPLLDPGGTVAGYMWLDRYRRVVLYDKKGVRFACSST